MSGVVFTVTAESPRRRLGDRDVYFCCEKCAQYFDEHAQAVAVARGMSFTEAAGG